MRLKEAARRLLGLGDPRSLRPRFERKEDIGHLAAAGRAFVIGNGPSLKGFDLNRLAGFDTLGMNAAYRHWDRIGWYPTYYCCLDDQLIETHHAEIDRLYAKGLVRGLFLSGVFFEKHPERLRNPDFLSLDRCTKYWFHRRGRGLGLKPIFNHPAFVTSAPSKVTTGAYAVRYMVWRGYTDIALMGVDLRYVEVLPEAKGIGGTGLVIERTPQSNPNYFFDDYQRAGDRYNIPNPEVHDRDLHPRSFAALAEDFSENVPGVSIVNTNAHSVLNDRAIFPYLPLERALEPAAGHPRPI